MFFTSKRFLLLNCTIFALCGRVFVPFYVGCRPPFSWLQSFNNSIRLVLDFLFLFEKLSLLLFCSFFMKCKWSMQSLASRNCYGVSNSRNCGNQQWVLTFTRARELLFFSESVQLNLSPGKDRSGNDWGKPCLYLLVLQELAMLLEFTFQVTNSSQPYMKISRARGGGNSFSYIPLLNHALTIGIFVPFLDHLGKLTSCLPKPLGDGSSFLLSLSCLPFSSQFWLTREFCIGREKLPALLNTFYSMGDMAPEHTMHAVQ